MAQDEPSCDAYMMSSELSSKYAMWVLSELSIDIEVHSPTVPVLSIISKDHAAPSQTAISRSSDESL